MSWMVKLYETYESSMGLDLASDKKPMPISHTLQNAHIKIVIDGDGNFKRASVLEKIQIVLPATEKSAGRSSGEAPHPLADKIQYVAKDYASFGGKKKKYFAGYEMQLDKWCESSFSHPMVMAVHKYIKRGQVVRDLVDNNVLHTDESGKLLTIWPHKPTDEQPLPLIYKVLPKEKGKVEFGSALVCWVVESSKFLNSETWKDLGVQQSWVDFDAMADGVHGLCYITGSEQILALNHPAKLRHTGDKAKLVSANDMSGFTFKGRFTDTSASIKAHGSQAVGISLEVTQKAHNALRWLISRQGYRNGDQVYVSWAVSNKDIPQPVASSWDLFDTQPVLQDEVCEKEHGVDHAVDLGSSFAESLKKYMAGYRTQLGPNEQIIIMGLDSATPGRMGIIYYRELLASEFLDRLHAWHNDFAWPQRHTKEYPVPNGKKKPVKKTIWPISSPVPRVIAEAAFGNVLKGNDTLKKSLMERILPCIVEGRPFPEDVMVSAVRRASNANSCDKWEWQRNIGVACALFKGFYLRHPDSKKRRKYKMALEEDRTNRDYLYGRLLAIAERIEEMAMIVAKEKTRTTVASRLMQRFSDNPYSTWLNIEKGIVPYMERLKSNIAPLAEGYKRLLDDVCDAFEIEDFKLKKQLSGEYLLGFHSQRKWLREFRLEKGKWVRKTEIGTEDIELEQ